MIDFNILQWNMNGFINNMSELQILINENNPSFISIQETHCNNTFNPIPPKNYKAYFFNSPTNTTSKQGVGILIKHNIPHKLLNIATQLQVVAIEINLNIKFSIISIYIPPSQFFTHQDLLNIFQNIRTPYIVLGDFNSWNTF